MPGALTFERTNASPRPVSSSSLKFSKAEEVVEVTSINRVAVPAEVFIFEYGVRVHALCKTGSMSLFMLQAMTLVPLDRSWPPALIHSWHSWIHISNHYRTGLATMLNLTASRTIAALWLDKPPLTTTQHHLHVEHEFSCTPYPGPDVRSGKHSPAPILACGEFHIGV